MTTNDPTGNENTGPNEKYPWRNEATLRRLYVEQGLSLGDVGDELGCDGVTVRNWLKRYDIPRRKPGDNRTGPSELRDADLLRELYVGQLKTCKEIGDLFGCHETSVLHWLREHKIPVRPRGSESDTTKLRDRELVRELYVERDLSQKGVAEHIGCSSSTAHDWIHYHGFDTPGSGQPPGEDHPNWKGGVTDSTYRLTYPKNRLEAIGRDGGKCRRCSLDREWHNAVFGWDIETHHIEPIDPEKPLEPQHRVENLITLCRPCHRALQGLPIDNRH